MPGSPPQATNQMALPAGGEDAHILVVDDDDRLRGLLSRYLGENGFRVTTAESAAAARDRLRFLNPDLVVLDVMMPGESGLTLTEALRAESRVVPILLLTARGAPEDRIAGFEAGADDYLPKPFEPRELVLRIRAMLRRAAPATAEIAGPIQLGTAQFDAARGELRGPQGPIYLTGGEAALLLALAPQAERGAVARGHCRSFGHGRCRRACHRRAGDAAAPQDRDGSPRAALPAHGARARLRAEAGVVRLRLPKLERLGRRAMPRSLLGRSLLIILIPLVIVEAVALQIFYGSHLDIISRRFTGAVADEIAFSLELMQRDPTAANRDWVIRSAFDHFDIGMSFEPAAILANRKRVNIIGPVDDDLAAALRDKVQRPFTMDWTSDAQSVLIRIQLADGVLDISAPRKRLYTATIYLFVLWIVGSALLLFGIAALFMRNQVRAIRRLAAAAEAFGMGRDRDPIKPEGAIEVRQAATAFNRMQERIRRFLSQRTEMLAGVSHDLRTPLTRLRLAIAMLPAREELAQDIAEMTHDVAEMDRMIGGYLAFARGEGTEESRGRSDLSSAARGGRERSARRQRAPLSRIATCPRQLTAEACGRDAVRRAVTNLRRQCATACAHGLRCQAALKQERQRCR